MTSRDLEEKISRLPDPIHHVKISHESFRTGCPYFMLTGNIFSPKLDRVSGVLGADKGRRNQAKGVRRLPHIGYLFCNIFVINYDDYFTI